MNIKKTIAEIVNNMDGVKLRSYSGRGMNGKYCLGVVLDSEADYFYNYTPITFLLTVVEELLFNSDRPSEVADIIDPYLKDAQTDNLGRDTIVYFPDIETTKDEF